MQTTYFIIPHILEINKGRHVWKPAWVTTLEYSREVSLATQSDKVQDLQDYQVKTGEKNKNLKRMQLLYQRTGELQYVQFSFFWEYT